ncbi:MAG: hypothetical protein ACK4P3_02715, partial [Fimbriimonadaceae bacterium]
TSSTPWKRATKLRHAPTPPKQDTAPTDVSPPSFDQELKCSTAIERSRNKRPAPLPELET